MRVVCVCESMYSVCGCILCAREWSTLLLTFVIGIGGLLSGTALTAKGLKPDIQVIGCEPEMADDAFQSFKAGHIVPQLAPKTIADGLRTSLGDLTYPLIKKHVDEIVTVSEEGIIKAMRLLWQTLKIVIEPVRISPMWTKYVELTFNYRVARCHLPLFWRER